MVGSSNSGLIRSVCKAVSHLPGDAAEIGVYRGSSAEVICKALPDSTVYLFDTFDGIPQSMITPIDSHKAGQFACDEKTVSENLKGYNVRLIKGIFPQTARPLKVRFVHVDVDLYESTKAALAWAKDNLIEGGKILCDDYGFGSCKGATKAIQDFAKTNRQFLAQLQARRAILTLLSPDQYDDSEPEDEE